MAKKPTFKFPTKASKGMLPEKEPLSVAKKEVKMAKKAPPKFGKRK